MKCMAALLQRRRPGRALAASLVLRLDRGAVAGAGWVRRCLGLTFIYCSALRASTTETAGVGQTKPGVQLAGWLRGALQERVPRSRLVKGNCQVPDRHNMQGVAGVPPKTWLDAGLAGAGVNL